MVQVLDLAHAMFPLEIVNVQVASSNPDSAAKLQQIFFEGMNGGTEIKYPWHTGGTVGMKKE